jgi:hypothetical protein
MLPLRFMLGFITIWVLMAFGMNGLSGLAMNTGVDAAFSPNTGITGMSTTISTDASGAPAQYQAPSLNVWQQFTQWAFFDYPALFNDPVTGLPDELRSAVRYSMLIIVGVGFIISFAYTMKQIFGL